MKYEIIATGSTGNAVVVNDNVLIDIGVPYKALEPYIPKLKLVLLTHQHMDHFRQPTVHSLARKRPALRWGCCEWMAKLLIRAGVDRRCIDVYEPGHWYKYGDAFNVMPEKLHHNAPNCGWHIYTGNELLFYATDTGDLDGVTARGYDLYMVEANHTRAEIAARAAEKEANGEYSYEFWAAQNHLSYEQTMDWLAENMGPKSLWIPMHGHIDRRTDDAEEVLLAETEG